MSDKGVSRTAPATPGLINMLWNFYKDWYNVWKSQGGIRVNGVPKEVLRPKPEGLQVLRVFGRGTSRGNLFTKIHPRLFPHIFILLASQASMLNFFQPMDMKV